MSLLEVVVVLGHGVLLDNYWHGLPLATTPIEFGNEKSRMFERHVDVAFAYLDNPKNRCEIMVLSGGCTRLIDGTQNRSEASGLMALLQEQHPTLWRKQRILEEPFARDSAENIICSLLAAFKELGHWNFVLRPVVLSQKALRVAAIGTGLGLGYDRIWPIISGGYGDKRRNGKRDPGHYIVGEEIELNVMIDWTGQRPLLNDPTQRQEMFMKKRFNRTPPQFKVDLHGQQNPEEADLLMTEQKYLDAIADYYEPATDCGPVHRAIQQLKALEPGHDHWRNCPPWPWEPQIVMHSPQ